ncbi:MAG TPA: hypothetical protein VJK52_01385 [Candidatus Nanoarchaeia archaeon]|nr:hypothetical protein [Candidatus Nanoarchaeia archaeon]
MGIGNLWRRFFPPPQSAEEDEVIMIACGGCKQRFPMAEMQYDKSGQNLACASCATRTIASKPAPVPQQKFGPKQYIPPTYDQRAPYICGDCGYKFTRHSSFKGSLRCTYCSSANIRAHTPMQAQDVLNHVENPQMLYKY